MTAKVKSINEKGFGFLSIAGQRDAFFHASDCSDDLQFADLVVGSQVYVEVADSPKGPRATVVARLKS